MERLPAQSGITYVNHVGKERILVRRRDVCMRADTGVCFAVFANENQAGVHYAMPVRNMLYDALSYTDQIRELGTSFQEMNFCPELPGKTGLFR